LNESESPFCLKIPNGRKVRNLNLDMLRKAKKKPVSNWL
jgi:hypothetical protein